MTQEQEKGTPMTKASNSLTSLLQGGWVPIIAGRRARLDASEGTGPSSVRRPVRTFHPSSRLKCCVPVLLCAVAGALAFTAVPALAATPETPETGKASAVTATTATLEDGVLNPHAALGELAEYEYRFRVSATECEGESSTAGMAAGDQDEAVPPVDLTNLQPSAHYTFCLFERSLATQETSPASTPEHFTTKAAPPEVLSESASAVNSKEATLNAELNANNQETSYVFEYSKTEAAGKLTGTIVKVSGASAIPKEEFGPRSVSVSTTGVLAAGTTYFYRVVATNEKAEKAEGVVESFTTVPAPKTEVPSPIGSSTATFKGKLTPLNATVASEYEFEYNVGEELVCTNEQATSPEPAGTGTGAKAVSTAVTGLQPNQKYTVCLVSVNAFGSEEDPASPPVHFTTKPAPPTIESESTAPVQPSEGNPHPRPAHEVRLEGKVNPNNEATVCQFQYGKEASLTKETTTTLCEPGGLQGFGPQSVALNVAGLESGETYYYRVVARNGAGETQGTEAEPIKQFTTAIEPEAPGTLEAEPIGVTTATLKGVLNPTKEGEAGTYEFAYRQSESECQITVTETVENPFNHQQETIQREENEKATTQEPSETKSPQPVSAPLTGLHPGAPYTFCLIAHNAQGETVTSSPVTFTTLPAAPTIVGEFTSGVETTTSGVETPIATLNAQIEPNGAAITSYHFEYIDQAGYEAALAESAPNPYAKGTSTPAAALTGLTGTETVSAAITGLEPGTTYHYRIVATNSLSPAGGTLGPDATFTTPGGQTTNSKE
jgi:hypothetical protein